MLEIKNLRAGYDGAEKLHGVSAALAPGRLTAVIGPNGCGKSTLLKCAAGLLRPMGGEILLEGRPLRDYPERERARRMSYMPQSRIVPEISVRRLAAHGRYPHLKWGQALRTSDEEIIRAAIARAGLEECADRQVGSLSGGERQRAYIAMMLAQEAEIMLLDEPTSYLDLSAQFELMELLRRLSAGGRSIAVVLHDLALALEYADEILLLRGGRQAASGAPGEICRSGEIERAFGVDMKRTPDGKYLFYPRRGEEETQP